jgi:CRISPR-associated endonuclease/helicase Cas3
VNHQLNRDLYLFWAKTTLDLPQQPRGYHPLLCHMIDVAMVARELWRSVLPRAACRSIMSSFGLDARQTEACLVWLVGLHDLGKTSPPFVLRKGAEYLRHLYDDSPFSISQNRLIPAKDAPHGIVTAQVLPEILRGLGFPPALAKQVSIVIGGHHGVIPRSEELNNLKHPPAKTGHTMWQAKRRELAHELARLVDVRLDVLPSLHSLFDNTTLMWLAGLTSVADWIGSNQTYFRCQVEDANNFASADFSNYVSDSEASARRALSELGWANWKTPRETRTFEQLFPDKTPPRGVQTAAVDLAPTLKTPGIVIIEAPMGEGKTEAAMYLADYWSVELEARGCYFALPTQATSNQMFGRVRDFLASRSDTETQVATLQLLHGHAALSAEFQLLLRKDSDQILNAYRITDVHSDGVGEQQARDHSSCTQANVIAAEWFTYRKRGLLAPFGVGTIDQVLLAVLQTSHVFVRLFALADKIVIVDEVHAYDAYMSALLERLLEWLAALRSPVVLLSATLPQKRRQALLRAYARGLSDATLELDAALTVTEKTANYPRLSWATTTSAGARHIETSAQSTRTLRLEWIDCLDIPKDDANVVPTKAQPFSLGERLQAVLTDDEGNLRGCVAVICNTVRRAQQVYEALRPYFPGKAFLNKPDDDAPLLDLLHARYLFKNRAAREERTLNRFGKPDKHVTAGETSSPPALRPACAVLVSTQIIEQSLDIDFDLMISELAPIDLLLQRSGRLHRHARAATRPVPLQQPTLWLIKPELDTNGVPAFGPSGYVYAPHILLRSWLELRERRTIEIPTEVEDLIEAVYDDERIFSSAEKPSLQEQWQETAKDLHQNRAVQESKARHCRLPSPTYDTDELLESFNRELAEDSPDVHSSLRALTRDDSLPSVSIVCLNSVELRRASLTEKPHISAVKFLLERSVQITKQGAVQAILALETPAGWRESPHLRRYRLIELDEQGQKNVGGYELRLDKELGIVIK